MDEQQPKRAGVSKLLWIFVILAMVLLWWYFRPDADPGATLAEQAADTTSAQAQAQVDPDDVLVDLKDDASPAQIARLEAELGIKLVLVDSTAAETKLFRAHVDPSRETAIIAALSHRPEVEIAEPDSVMQLSPEEQEIAAPPAQGGANQRTLGSGQDGANQRTLGSGQDGANQRTLGSGQDGANQRTLGSGIDTKHEGFPNDPKYKFQWHLNQIGMPAAWKLADGNGVIVAVLDTGVAYENYQQFTKLPDLEGITFVDPYDFVSNTAHANDDHGHGSHVTGTIAQATNNGIGVAGVALNVRIMPLKVLSGSGSGSVAGIADAIHFAADHGAKVINMSLGGAFPSRVLKKAVEYAHGKGVTVVCAAGNESRNKVGYPAAYPGAVAVSATQFDEATTFYSNYGKDIDIAAPGGNTRVDQNNDGLPDGVLQNTIAIGDPTKNDYYGYMGTSMASPHVAGVAALVIGEGITDPNMVEKILKDSARKPHDQKYTTDRYGAGIIDAPAAILKARSSSGGWQLGLGLLMAGAVAASARKRGLGTKLGPSYLAGVMVGASGLFFLPYLAPSLSSLPVIHALTVGMPSWDLGLLGASGHGNVLFFSALIPLAALSIGYSMPRLRGVLAGLAVGVAAHLAFFAVVPMTQLHYVPVVATIWLAVNALACIGLARLALRR